MFELSDLFEEVEMEDKWGLEEVDFLLCFIVLILVFKLKGVME